jgi:hypothetical protein
MMRRWLILLTSVVALAALGSACGGGSADSSGGGGGELTKAEFVKQADAICTKTDEDLLAALETAGKAAEGKTASKGEKEAVAMLGLARVQKEAEEIGELQPPSGDEGKASAIVKGIEEGVKKAEANPLQLSEAQFEKAGKLAAAYGMKACAEPL